MASLNQLRFPAKALSSKIVFRGTAFEPCDTYTELSISTSGTRPVFLRPWSEQQRESNHQPDGKYEGMEPITLWNTVIGGLKYQKLIWDDERPSHRHCICSAHSHAFCKEPSVWLGWENYKLGRQSKNKLKQNTCWYNISIITFWDLFLACAEYPTLTVKHDKI